MSKISKEFFLKPKHCMYTYVMAMDATAAVALEASPLTAIFKESLSNPRFKIICGITLLTAL
jgi:cystathionine beta-lyase/cystathionine gamma-synthase